MKQTFDTCVLGGGIPGIYAMYKLDDADTCLINSGKNLGGMANGFSWNNYNLDFGCRFLDGDSNLFRFYELVGKATELNINYGAYNSGVLKNDIASPEYNSKELLSQVLEELENLNPEEIEHQSSLEGVLISKFGFILGSYLSTIQKKITGHHADIISSHDYMKLPLLHRIRVLDDVISNQLKSKNDYLETILCSSLASRNQGSKQVSMYSSNTNLRSFGINAQSYLKNRNLKFKNNFQIKKIKKNKKNFEIISEDGQIIECKHIISTLGYGQISNIFNLPKVNNAIYTNFNFVAIEVSIDYISDTHYVQDFDVENISYRTSNMGNYSNQIIDSKTFILVEIPYGHDAPNFKIEKIIKEVIKQGILKKGAEINDYKIFDFKNIISFNSEISDYEIDDNFFELDYKIFDTKNRLYYLDTVIKNLTF